MSSPSESQVGRPDGNHVLRLRPNQAKALVCVLGVLVFVLDIMAPADVNLAIFYSFIIVVCSWTCSLIFLWGTAIIFAAAIFPGLLLSPAPVTGPIAWVYWVNRLFAMVALVLVAGLVHFRIRSVRMLESRNQELHAALDEIKTLRGTLLICSYCKKIATNPDTWMEVENYVRQHSEAEFNHGVCPVCLQKEMRRVA